MSWTGDGRVGEGSASKGKEGRSSGVIEFHFGIHAHKPRGACPWILALFGIPNGDFLRMMVIWGLSNESSKEMGKKIPSMKKNEHCSTPNSLSQARKKIL